MSRCKFKPKPMLLCFFKMISSRYQLVAFKALEYGELISGSQGYSRYKDGFNCYNIGSGGISFDFDALEYTHPLLSFRFQIDNMNLLEKLNEEVLQV